jgi:TetR/AcrR family transcriptional regulator of autoinduction and epiphytic fitness
LATDAAERVFLVHGYHGTTMADVARSAGMSKKTIYQVFESKGHLLEAVLSRRLAALTRPVDASDDDQPIEAVLTRLVMQIFRFVVSSEELAFTRLMVADSTLGDAVIEVMDRKGLFAGRTTLAQWLARQAANGTLDIDEPNAAAEMLVGMALGELHIRLLMKTISPPGETDLQQRVARAVALFLHGTRPR